MHRFVFNAALILCVGSFFGALPAESCGVDLLAGWPWLTAVFAGSAPQTRQPGQGDRGSYGL